MGKPTRAAMLTAGAEARLYFQCVNGTTERRALPDPTFPGPSLLAAILLHFLDRHLLHHYIFVRLVIAAARDFGNLVD
jgi:hypothetical protein